MPETKKCKYCQSEIDKKAKVCPVCKRTIKGPGCLLFILSLIIVIALVAVIASNMNGSIQKDISGVSNESEYITMDEFNKIKTGMSYDEVKKIIGSEGTVSTESGSGDYQIKIITWYGSGVAGSNANVTFTNDEVTGKAQVGLK